MCSIPETTVHIEMLFPPTSVAIMRFKTSGHLLLSVATVAAVTSWPEASRNWVALTGHRKPDMFSTTPSTFT